MMIKALMSFSLGGLVVFVPQGAKTQEKPRPTVEEAEVVVLDDVTETAQDPKPVDVRVVETPGGFAALRQDRKVQWVESMDKKDLLRLLQRLEVMSKKVKNLDVHAQQLDKALVDVQGVYLKGKNGLPGEYVAQDKKRKLAELERKMKEIAVMRDRLQVEIETARRAIAKTKSAKSGKAWTFEVYGKDGKPLESSKRRDALVKQYNLEQQKAYVKAKSEEFKHHMETARKGANQQAEKAAKAYRAKVDLARIHEHAAAQDKAARHDAVINKLEREIAKLTAQLQRLNPGMAPRTGMWTTTPPKRSRITSTSPFGPRTARAPRATTTQGRRYPARTSTSTPYRRRPAPSTLGSEGKVIWNEIQSVRSDIHQLRQMMERYMKNNAPGSRSGKSSGSSTRRGSVGGPLRGRVLAPRGVALGNGHFGVTTLGPDQVIVVEQADPIEATKKTRRYWYAPGTTQPPAAPPAPRAPKAGIETHKVEYLPMPKEGEPLRLRYKMETVPEPKKSKSHDKSKSSRKRGTISWPGTTESTTVNTKKSSEIRRL